MASQLVQCMVSATMHCTSQPQFDIIIIIMAMFVHSRMIQNLRSKFLLLVLLINYCKMHDTITNSLIPNPTSLYYIYVYLIRAQKYLSKLCTCIQSRSQQIFIVIHRKELQFSFLIETYLRLGKGIEKALIALRCV